jgi:cytochrome c
MKHVVLSALILGSGCAGAWAQDSKEIKELLQASGCMSCHASDEKVVGPAFKAIAGKYAGQADAADALMQSVRNGSRGKWGRTPMPPHTSLSAADLKTLTTWILAQKP